MFLFKIYCDIRKGTIIHAGAGGVGHIAVQLAARKGARVITTVSDEKKRDFVLGLGAEKAVLYRDEDFVQAVLDWTGGEGSLKAIESLTGDESLPAILHKAIELEKESILYYIGLKDAVPSESAKRKIDEIIGEEKGHIVTLKKELESI